MTLRQLYVLALRYTSRRARFPIKWWTRRNCEWVPAHELGHAFVATPEQLTRRRFGLCRVYSCQCPGNSCFVFEACAMELSGAWMIACGRPDICDIEQSSEYTPGIELILTPRIRRRMIRRMHKLDLWPVPTTLSAIEAYAKKRGLRA